MALLRTPYARIFFRIRAVLSRRGSAVFFSQFATNRLAVGLFVPWVTLKPAATPLHRKVHMRSKRAKSRSAKGTGPHRPLKHLTVSFAISRTMELLHHPLFWFLTVVANTSILLGALAMYLAERAVNPDLGSFFDAIWWSVSTITTVGYGDITPVTPPGRLVGMLLMLFGTATFGAFTALFAAVLLEPEMNEVEEQVEELNRKLR